MAGAKDTETTASNYNHATTNLAIHSNETSQDKLSEVQHRQSRCMTNYMKTFSILHADFTESMKVVENLFKKG